MSNMKSLKVLYFTCMEITKNNNIHQNQVFGLADKGVDYFFYFMSPMFIITRSGFSLNFSKQNKDRSDTDESIIPIPSIMVLMHLIIIPFFLLITVPLFFLKIKKIKPQIVHCRALLSTFVAISAKKTFGLKYKIVCDPRSVYVEECVIHKAFRMNGINYKGWKKLERWIYRNSDACIGLSDYFADYMKASNPKSYFVPALVQDHLVFDEKLRESMRQEYELTDKNIVFVYIGSIGTWHSIKLYIECLKRCRAMLPKEYNMKIILLTGNKRAIEELTNSFSSEQILMTGQVPPSEVKKVLCASDYGIVPGSDLKGEHYDLLYATMIASKAEEFLASGLPILVNSRIASLAKMIQECHAGFSFSEDSFIVDFKEKFNHAKISDHFNHEFRATGVVNKYKKIYQDILS